MKIDELIYSAYNQKKENIKRLAAAKEKDRCLQAIYDIWMYMNRYRNCDLGFYFDEDIHDIALQLNEQSYDTSHQLIQKNKLKVAFITDGFSNTGGASLPHRFMLPKVEHPKYDIEQYVLVTNLKNITDYQDYESYRYLKEKLEIKDFQWLAPSTSWVKKGEQIQEWIRQHEIDALVVSPDPASLYALGSNPAPIQTILSQDCYTWTLGPGVGDLSFFVTTDQVFKYDFKNPRKEKNFKVTLLPLHSQDYIQARDKVSKQSLNIPEDAILSGTTNMWKCFFGDNEDLMNGIATLIRKHPNYHHIFAGTPRCLDNLEFFLNKNPDIRSNVHYGGIFNNIYTILDTVDFWINSYPTSGGSDIEIALLGKPTIEFLSNRNLDLHGSEFLRSRECDVVNLDEFIALGTRFIKDKNYRQDLGQFLKDKIEREFNKENILFEKIYTPLIDLFEEKALKKETMPTVTIERSMQLEKYIAFYNTEVTINSSSDEKFQFLNYVADQFPLAPFPWVKIIELAIDDNQAAQQHIISSINDELLKDYRIQYLLGHYNKQHGENEGAIDHLQNAIQLCELNKEHKMTIQEELTAIKFKTGDEAKHQLNFYNY